MGDVVPFGRARRAAASKQRKARRSGAPGDADASDIKPKKPGNTLCRRGFHKWEIDQNQRFDVRAGGLVTVRRCVRCGSISRTLD